jgi:hypothetical protein
VYTNSLLATLNARKMIQTMGAEISDMSFFMKDSGKTSIGAHVRWKIPFIHIIESHFYTQKPANISIKIDTTKELAEDYVDIDKTEVGASRVIVR